jgi:hypothetical protein
LFGGFANSIQLAESSPYGDVTQAKGNNLSTGAIIAISAGAAVGVALPILYIIIATNNS